ncbi:TetR/AcrR family transcriptional regulator [Nocardia brasiliensis]|uniref:Transcriptional regulator n=1 Tax=Nocardia brasiliensis (strain ATCC 700358 / HUJEG-1) TaxID=1133849 RepID=K0EV83_NOCB7|nr:TetR/AcrR family transcriptional regulator [Nocardia brasiliensis]AFU03703.1 transcriptional regulator [Nocardia brasiliensis ATCC 700358]OCF89559.1 transcriptional regulator [Nocardia brasiliensis]
MSSNVTRRRGRPIRVPRDDVVTVTTRLLTAGGAQAFSMRKLADELGVSTAAVYHHFPTKAALMIAVLSARADELDRPDLPADPRDRLVAIVAYLIDVLHQMPWVADILVSGESFGRAAMWILDEFVDTATRLGATDDYAGYMYAAIWRFVLGELMMRRAEDERAEAARRGDPRPRWTDQADDEILAEFPTTVRMLPKWATIRDEYRTSTAVGHLIDGLIAGIPS